MKSQAMSISEFMSGSYKEEKQSRNYGEMARRVGVDRNSIDRS